LRRSNQPQRQGRIPWHFERHIRLARLRMTGPEVPTGLVLSICVLCCSPSWFARELPYGLAGRLSKCAIKCVLCGSVGLCMDLGRVRRLVAVFGGLCVFSQLMLVFAVGSAFEPNRWWWMRVACWLHCKVYAGFARRIVTHLMNPVPIE
jgi:hypothetical protein